MYDVDISAVVAQEFDPEYPNGVLKITFTNNAAFTPETGTNIYYYAVLTDSTTPTPLTQEVNFRAIGAGTVIPANTDAIFYADNTGNLVPAITGGSAKIFYTAA